MMKYFRVVDDVVEERTLLTVHIHIYRIYSITNYRSHLRMCLSNDRTIELRLLVVVLSCTFECTVNLLVRGRGRLIRSFASLSACANPVGDEGRKHRLTPRTRPTS